MSEFAAEFVFVPTYSFKVSADGQLLRPFPGKDVGPAELIDRYVYAFAESSGGSDPWVLAAVYKILPPGDSGQFPLVSIVSGTDSDGSELLSEPSETVLLPTATSGGIDDVKYCFLCLDHLLLSETEQALMAGSDVSPLPIVSLRDAANPLFVGADGSYATSPAPNMRRAVQVVDPYAVGEQLARTFKERCNAVVAYTDPRAGLTDRQVEETKERLAKQPIAMQLDALRLAGKDFRNKLKTGPQSLDQYLMDMDPNQPKGELGKLIRQREDFALAMINMTTARVWDLLERDARATVARGNEHYGRHLKVTCSIHESLLMTELGEEFWLRICERFPIKGEGLERATPENGMEELARRFIFAENAAVEPREGWEEPALLTGGNAAFGVYAAMTKVIARASLEKVGDAAGGIVSDQALDKFASGALRNKAGLTAYRWAYHLRNDFFVESVTLHGEQRAVTWFEKNNRFSVSPVELVLEADSKEFTARFANSGFDFEHVGRLLTIASIGFSFMAVREAIEKKSKDLDVKLLQTGSAALSLVGDGFVTGLLEKLELIPKGGSAAKVLKFVGVAGAVLGAIAGVREGVRAKDNGEGDVALVTGGGAVISGAVAAWAGLAAFEVVAGPPGWLMLAGTAIGLLAPIVSAAFLQDDDVENMVEHCVFGRQHGEPHDAPKLALCEGSKFSAWAGTSLDSLKAQHLGFANLIWAFRVRGLRTSNPMRSDPTVEILPPRLVPDTCVDVDADVTWRQGDDEVRLRGRVRLHCRPGPNLENLSGDHFGGDDQSLSGVHTTLNPTTHHIEWTIEPKDPTLRAKVQNMPIRVATLTLQLRALGPKNEAMVFPILPKNHPGAQFRYELMRNAALNRTEVSSVSIYV